MKRAFLALCCLNLGCTLKEAAENLRPTDFITSPATLAPPKNTPFDLTWASPHVSSWGYDTIVVDAVQTEYLDSDNWIFSAGILMPTRNLYKARVQDLAEYIQTKLLDEFQNYSDRDQAGVIKGAPVESEEEAPALVPLPLEMLLKQFRTLRIQLSIVEANFGDPLVYGGLLAVPLPGVANLSTAVKAPSLTLEVRLIDEKTGGIVAEIIDRRFPQLKIVDINRLTISLALHELADSFAEDLVKSFYRKRGERVGRRLPFSLLPW